MEGSLDFVAVADPGFPSQGEPKPQFGSKPYIITALKRSLRSRRLCFYTCLSVILFTAGWVGGGVGSPGPHPGEYAVRILLECILVWEEFCRKLHENEMNWTEWGVSGAPLDPPMHWQTILFCTNFVSISFFFQFP